MQTPSATSPSSPKSAERKPWDARLANRLVRPLRDGPVHPNWLTTLGLGSGLTAAALFARGGESASLGALVLAATMVLDHADGELARMSGKTSAFGHSYDRAVDLIVKLSTFLGMGVGLRSSSLGNWGPVFGACAGAALVVIFRSRTALSRRRGVAAFTQPAAGGFEIEDILYAIAPITWLGGLPAFVVAAGIGAPLFAGFTLLQLRRAIREDRSAGRVDPPTPTGGDGNRGSVAAVRWASPGLVAGLSVFVALLLSQGITTVTDALAVAGWGLVGIAAFHLLPLVADAFGWRSLADGHDRPSPARFVRARWIGESINGLLPVFQIGGNVVKAQMLTRDGMATAAACATVVVDVTLVMLTQLGFTLLGVVLLLARIGSERVVTAALIGALLTGGLGIGFLAAQRAGLFHFGAQLAERLIQRPEWGSLALSAAEIDAEIVATYARHGRLAGAAAWHLASWLLGTGEVWLALHALGHPVDLGTAMLLESLGQAVRAAAFAVPGALGIQEGGYVVLGRALGLSPEVCLALSLTKRSRELFLGIPGLVAWQWNRRAGSDSPAPISAKAQDERGHDRMSAQQEQPS